jgi:hypothetical protein
MVFVGYAENHAADCYRMWYPNTRKVTESRDVIWLHRMYYQDIIGNDIAILPDIRITVPELSNEDTMVLPRGGVDPVSDESDIENELASLTCDDVKLEQDSKLEAREGIDDDTVNTEASNSESSKQSVVKTRSGRQVKFPRKYDGFEMTAAEIRLIQLEQMNETTSEVSLIGATGEGFSHTTELHVMNYKQAMLSKEANDWQIEVDKELIVWLIMVCGKLFQDRRYHPRPRSYVLSGQ